MATKLAIRGILARLLVAALLLAACGSESKDASTPDAAADGAPVGSGGGRDSATAGASGSWGDTSSAGLGGAGASGASGTAGTGVEPDAGFVGLLCCNGERSPTCACSDPSLQGCCSGKMGVCDCGR